MAGVMIGVDPHKGSHTAVAVGAYERQPGRPRVRASAEQARPLTEWAAGLDSLARIGGAECAPADRYRNRVCRTADR